MIDNDLSIVDCGEEERSLGKRDDWYGKTILTNLTCVEIYMLPWERVASTATLRGKIT